MLYIAVDWGPGEALTGHRNAIWGGLSEPVISSPRRVWGPQLFGPNFWGTFSSAFLWTLGASPRPQSTAMYNMGILRTRVAALLYKIVYQCM